MSAYDYLPKYVMDMFTNTGCQDGNPNPLMIARYFTPDSSWVWYASEFDPSSGMFFGYVCGHEREWWYFSLEELQNVRWKFGLRVERDLYFHPTPFFEIGLQ